MSGCSARLLLWQIQCIIAVGHKKIPVLVADLAKNTGSCDVAKVFRKDCSFYETLKAWGVSGEISTSPSKKQGLVPVGRFIPVNTK